MNPIIENCIWCGKTFVKTRKDARCCNVKCASAFCNYKNYNKLTKEEIDNFNYEDRSEKSKNYSLREETDVSYYLYNKYYHKIKKALPEIKIFIDKIKSQDYYGDQSDIFQLINLYDIVFPTTNISCNKDKEIIFSTLFIELVEFYKNKTSGEFSHIYKV